MNHLTILFHWLSQHPLSSAALFFGGATLAVMLYTYITDYKTLINEDVEEGRSAWRGRKAC